MRRSTWYSGSGTLSLDLSQYSSSSTGSSQSSLVVCALVWSTRQYVSNHLNPQHNLVLFQVRRKYDDDIRKSLEYVLAKSQIGDWFVLYQLCKNCNPYFYREFIRELAREIRHKPKKNKSKGNSNGKFYNFNHIKLFSYIAKSFWLN